MIFDSTIFFQNDTIDLSFVCNSQQISELQQMAENKCTFELFGGDFEISTITDEQKEALKYFVFVDMIENIVSNYDSRFDNSYYAKMLFTNASQAARMTTDRISQALQYGCVQCHVLKYLGQSINPSYCNTTNYL